MCTKTTFNQQNPRINAGFVRFASMRIGIEGEGCKRQDFCASDLCSFEQHFVRDKRDKFPGGGLFICGIYFHAENLVDVFYLSSVPCDFYGVTNCAFDLGRGGVESRRNGRVEFLCYAVYDFGVVDRDFDCFAQELIAFYVRGYADRDKEISDFLVERAVAFCGLGLTRDRRIVFFSRKFVQRF